MIVANFAKGLGASISNRAAQAQEEAMLKLLRLNNGIGNSAAMPMGRFRGGDALVQLQYCGWHAIEAIKKRLI